MVPMDKEKHIVRIINYCQCSSRISCAGFLGRAIVGARRRTVGDGAGMTVGDGVGRTVGDEAWTGGACG